MVKCFLIFGFLMAGTSVAFANLQVFPLRVVLSEKERSAQIAIRHQGTSTTKYRIKAIFYQMQPDGSMKEITEPGEKEGSAAKLIRFSPKEVTLQPKVEQVVRVLARFSAELPDGEYRTHLHFEEMDNSDSPTIETRGSDGAQLFLKAHLAVAIPVIVKKGLISSKVTLSNLKVITMPDKKPGFSFDLVREGNGFAYGDIEVQSVSATGETKVLNSINGVSSYINKRVVSYPMGVEKIPAGKLRILFKQSAIEGGGPLGTVEINVK